MERDKVNILLLDTNVSAKPIYDYLQKTGNNIFVIGSNPDDHLSKLFKKNYINLDYRDIVKVIQIIESMNINFIVPGGNDESYKTCSIINEKIPFFNIDPVDVNKLINNKRRFRMFSQKIGLNVPHLVPLDEIKEALPVIIKPVDSYSGQGITKISIYSVPEIDNAIKKAKRFSREGNFIIEKFVKGQLFSHTAFIENGSIIIDFFVKEYCTKNPYTVNTSFVSNQIDKKTVSKIQADISILVGKLALCDGLIHTQFIYDGVNFWIIEVTRRCPGDLYSKLIQYSNGFPYAEFYAKPFLNIKNKVKNIVLKENFVIRHTLSLSKNEVFNSLVLKHPIKLIEFIPLAITGDEPKNGKAGLFFFSSLKENKKDFFSILNKTIDNQLYSFN